MSLREDAFWLTTVGGTTLLLRLLAPGDEVAARAAHDELSADGFSFLLDLREGEA
ncbi:MAG TPA: hypothetical protein VED59_04045 [Acidimicrobiales bacterium]|nr:hypothetical protein [Acidimicrobiales bacterium]